MLSVVLALAISGNGLEPSTGRGVIEGQLLFPACDVPADLEVCAESADGHLRCTSKLEFLAKTIAYRIEVPAGEYKVFARTESTLPGVRAYYTEAVRCGLDASCNDHTPLAISVRAGARVTSVHPADWAEPEAPPVLSYVIN
jgi:hypothetical protein